MVCVSVFVYVFGGGWGWLVKAPGEGGGEFTPVGLKVCIIF